MIILQQNTYDNFTTEYIILQQNTYDNFTTEYI